jgi:predicted GNAT family acetyltransferase
MLNLAIEHLVGQQRFQVIVEGQACVADYRLRDGVMAIVHTEVAPRLNGRGMAGPWFKPPWTMHRHRD